MSSVSLTAEAEKAIRAEVGRELARRFLIAASVFGVVNIAALIGMYWTVLGIAKNTAESVAKQEAEAIVNKNERLI